jgi:hypothetical protein
VAQNTTFTSNTASLLDPYDPANDAAATAPALTANGDYFVIMHGTCTGGSVTDPGDDCDEFFKITTGAAPATVSVQLDWFTGSDVDILWCDATCSSFVGNFDGATSANPEKSTVTIPAGTTWNLWINFFDPAGAASTIARLRVSGLP